MLMRLLLIVGTFLVAASATGVPQGTLHRLEHPDAVAAERFTLIKGLRELADGRVLVTDWVEQRLVVVDLSAGTAEDIGRTGRGPGEYWLPGQLLALPGDSTLLVDVGNGRLAVIGPDLTFTRTIPVQPPGVSYTITPRAADAESSLYFQLSPFAAGRGRERQDSVPIGKWSPRDGTISFIGDGMRVKAYTSRPPGPSRGGMPFVAFARQDDWSLASDGWVAVVRSEPYRVEWYGGAGERMEGPEVNYQPVPVTMDDRRGFVRRWLTGTYVSGRGGDAGFGLVSADQQSPTAINRTARDGLFEDEFPPFAPGQVWTVENESVWVMRWLPAGVPPTYDVFDRTGERIAIVTLPAGRRIIGFGAGVLYATAQDDMGLLTLERYQRPAPPAHSD